MSLMEMQLHSSGEPETLSDRRLEQAVKADSSDAIGSRKKEGEDPMEGTTFRKGLGSYGSLPGLLT